MYWVGGWFQHYNIVYVFSDKYIHFPYMLFSDPHSTATHWSHCVFSQHNNGRKHGCQREAYETEPTFAAFSPDYETEEKVRKKLKTENKEFVQFLFLEHL